MQFLWVMTCFPMMDYNILPKKELHRNLQVESRIWGSTFWILLGVWAGPGQADDHLLVCVSPTSFTSLKVPVACPHAPLLPSRAGARTKSGSCTAQEWVQSRP